MALAATLMGCGEEAALRKVSATGFFDPPEVNFGVRNVGLTYELQTSLRNTSGQPIRVQVIRFDPATDAFLPRLADGGTLRGTTLAPGDRVELIVGYAPSVIGNNDAVMTVVFADFVIDVDIFATAREVAPARPQIVPSAIAFSDVPLNGQATQLISLTNAGETDGALVDVTADSPFSVRAAGGQPLSLPTPALAPGASLNLEVVFSPRRLGSASGRLVFELDSQEQTEVTVTGDAAPAGLLACTPNAIDYGAVPRGRVVRQPVLCRASGGPYRLAQIRFAPGSSPSFRVASFPTGLDADGRVALDIDFVSDSLPRPHAATLELVAGHGVTTTIAVTAETIAPDPTSTVVAIDLGWNTARTDFDLHLVRSEGALFNPLDDCYWASKNPSWGAPDDGLDDPFLDRDDTNGFGPETINLAEPAESRYDVYVQYFDYDVPTSPVTTVSVGIALNGTAPVTYERQMDDCGLMWHVGRIEMVSGTARFTEAGGMLDRYRVDARCPVQGD